MDYIKIGMIVKPHGVRGEVKVLPLTDDVKRFDDLKNIYIKNDNLFLMEEIASMKNQNDFIILKLKEFNKLEDAESLRDKYIFVQRNDAVKLYEDEYYTQDLVGCEIRFHDMSLGKVIDVINEGSCDIFVVEYKKSEVYYPFVKELVASVDIENKTIIINQMEGYFD